MSPDTRLLCGLSLILIPTIVYGGLTVLGVVSNRLMGIPGPSNLSATQIALYRAGHAHAGVLTLLAMLLQIAIDYAAIPGSLVWPVRVGAIAASILVSGGFFAVAHAVQRPRRVVGIAESQRERVLAFARQQVAVRANGGRIFHQSLAIEVDHADQRGGVAKGFDGAQRVAGRAIQRGRCSLDQERRPRVVGGEQTKAAHHGHRRRTDLKRPLLGDARLALEPLSVTGQARLAGKRKFFAEVPLGELSFGAGLPKRHRRRVCPGDAALARVEQPDRRGQHVQ